MKIPGKAILSSRPLSAPPFPTLDPFLFCVYHKDKYPQGNEKMEAPYPGNGSDFDADAEYRMYHGDLIPGFPQHPHRGFETITATIDGLVDHADSLGNGGRYGQGDVQWMTAGKGVVHGEMFPLLNSEGDNPLRFFQIWLNLPAKNKMADPRNTMFWADQVPKYSKDGVQVTVWAGNYFGATAESQNSPPPDSWANDPENDVAVLHVAMQPGTKLTLPKANADEVNRSLFLVEGSGAKVDSDEVKGKAVLTLDATKEVEIEVEDETEFLLLQGRPIKEPVAKYGPFVMNTHAELEEAFHDYQKTQFGGWPWPRDDMVFPKEKTRFALENGVEIVPNTCTD